jgi:hypothetical protein
MAAAAAGTDLDLGPAGGQLRVWLFKDVTNVE